MRTDAIGKKLGFTVADYAAKHGYGIGSFRLKDGSSIKILQDADKKRAEIWQVKCSRLLDRKVYEGRNRVLKAQQRICSMEKLAESVSELTSAWAQSLYKSSL